MKVFFRRVFAALCPPTILKMISFAMVGGANALVDFGVFAFAYKLLGMPLVPSNVVAWLVAVSGSYVMNTLITFRRESGRILRREDYLKFVASGILGVFLATTTLVALSYFVEVLVAKLVSILVGFAANFSMSHFVVFRPKGPFDGKLKNRRGA
jgi:putative flippase GtrA